MRTRYALPRVPVIQHSWYCVNPVSLCTRELGPPASAGGSMQDHGAGACRVSSCDGMHVYCHLRMYGREGVGVADTQYAKYVQNKP